MPSSDDATPSTTQGESAYRGIVAAVQRYAVSVIALLALGFGTVALRAALSAEDAADSAYQRAEDAQGQIESSNANDEIAALEHKMRGMESDIISLHADIDQLKRDAAERDLRERLRAFR